MTGSLDPSKKFQHNGTGKPKLARLNATKNTKYVPHTEGSPTVSLPAQNSRSGAVISGESLTSFRLSGNNVEEKVQQICNIIGISRNEFLGIPQAAWQSLSDRKTRSGPLLSSQETSLVHSEVQPSQTTDSLPARSLDSWSRATSDSPDSSTTFQNEQRDKASPSSDKQKTKSSDLLLNSPHEETMDSSATGGTASLVGPAKALSVGAADTAASESPSGFVSPWRSHLHRKTTETSSSSRPIVTPDIVLQSISEHNPLVDIGRPYTPPTCDSDTTSCNEHSRQRDAPLSVSKFEENLQVQKYESNLVSRLSPTTARMSQEVPQNSVSATSRSYNFSLSTGLSSNQIKNTTMISAVTSQVLLPGSTAIATRQGNTSTLKFFPRATKSNAAFHVSGNTEDNYDQLVMEKVTAQGSTEDMKESSIENETSMGDVAANLGSRHMTSKPENHLLEELMTSLNEEPSRIGHNANYARPRIPWSFWRKGDLLGSGSFGTVYEGVNSEGLFFAVKEVSLGNEGRGGQQSILQLEQEIEILSQFQHENIVQYLGTQREQLKLYIFLEFMTKGALSTLYKKIPLFDSQIRSYTRQILSGLKYLHEKDIVHRDVKCANILVHANGTVKLADFGMAKVLKNSEQLKSCKGSAYWMAPEVINPRKTYSLPADIWSLGCTVLEMSTGSPPFGDLEWHSVFWKVGHGEVPPIPDKIQDDMKDFIQQCLQVDPSLRPTAAALLEHPFLKLRSWHLTSMHSSPTPVLLENSDFLVKYDSGDLDEFSHSERSQGTSSYSSSDSSVFRDDEVKVSISSSRSPAHSVRTIRSNKRLQ